MHGSICLIVKKFVDTRFGGQTWQTILNNAGCSDLVISPIETYPDEAVMAILESACEELEIELAAALYEIGRFAAAELIGFSRGMLHPDWKTFELLANLESMIHRTVRMNHEGVQPASIQAFELSPDKMQVVYASGRGLCELARGILVGLGEYFQEEIEVVEETCCKKGDAFCTFSVCRVTADVANPNLENMMHSIVSDVLHSMVDEDEIDSLEIASSAEETVEFDSSDIVGGSTDADSQLEFAADHVPGRATSSLPKQMGRYAIQDVLGVGGTGIVYRAIDESLMRPVAIKTLKSPKVGQSLRDQFLAEARRLAKLNHPNVVRIYDVGKVGSQPYFIMEHLEGITLSRRLARSSVSEETASAILKRLLSGLNAVHSLGMVHRDVKPGNVILGLDGKSCHLLDFGLSAEYDPSAGQQTTVGGTQGYMAPERLAGLPGDYRSDYFSLGCIAYELFSEVSMSQLRRAHPLNWMSLKVVEESDRWQQTRQPIRDVVLAMLADDPAERLCCPADIEKALSPEQFESSSQ